MKTILGIDVGMNGAFSFYDGKELLIYDTPTFERNKTNRLDCIKISEFIRANNPDHAWIEWVNAYGMGATSAYNFGFGCGAIEGILSAIKVPFSYVTPQVWKKAVQCPKDKNASRMRASQLLPDHTHNWPLKKHDGRAESALIALYGAKYA